MSRHHPLLSIGMPVFNGDKYLQSALESIQNQTFGDFELIISDNASTDSTEEICRSYAEHDPRIKYSRNNKNLGAAYNFNRVVHVSAGKYFKWAAHDDMIAPTFLEKCINQLEKDSSIVLCFSQVQVIDGDGNFIEMPVLGLEGCDSKQPHKRFKTLLLQDRSCFDVFGVIRRGALMKTPLIAEYVASDRILRAQLGLMGRFYVIPEPLFLSRDHPDRSIRSLPAHHLRVQWFAPNRPKRRCFPHWRLLIEYLKCIRRSVLCSKDQWKCSSYLLLWLAKDLNSLRLITDLVIATYPKSWDLFFKNAVNLKGKTRLSRKL